MYEIKIRFRYNNLNCFFNILINNHYLNISPMSQISMTKGLFCGFLFLFTSSLSAQNTNNLLFHKHHLTFQVGYLSNQIQQKGYTNEQGYFSIRATKGGFVGGVLTINPFQYLGLEVGGNISLQTFGYDVQLTASEFGIDNDFNRVQNIPEIYAEVPLAAVPRFSLNENNWLYARLGLTISWFSPLAINFNLDSHPQDLDKNKELGEVQFRFSADNPYFSALTGFGLQHVTKDKNLIGLSLHTTFGFSNILEGKYMIWDDEVTVNSGTFHSKGNYISLVFSYTFTGAKKLEEEIHQLKIN